MSEPIDINGDRRLSSYNVRLALFGFPQNTFFEGNEKKMYVPRYAKPFFTHGCVEIYKTTTAGTFHSL